MFCNISPTKENRPHPNSGEVRPFFFFGGRCIELASPLRTLFSVQFSKPKAKYIYQKLNIYKEKLLNCNIYIKNPNSIQTISNPPPNLLQSNKICIFADDG